MKFPHALTFAALSLVACSSSPSSPSSPAQSQSALTGTVALSELLINPPGADANNEYIELECVPSADLSAYTLVFIDGDEGNYGEVDLVISLAGKTCGSGGFLIVQRGTVYSGAAGVSYFDSAWSASVNLENGTNTMLLVKDVATLAVGDDLDADDDGVLDDDALGASAEVVDGLTVNDGDRFAAGDMMGALSDAAYSTAVIVTDDWEGDVIARFAGTSGSNSANWYGGELVAGATAPPYTFKSTPADRSTNFPASASGPTPGAANATNPSANDDLTAAPPADLSGSDLTGGVAPAPDLAGQTASPDLTKPRDLSDSPAVEDLAGGEEPLPDLKRTTNTGKPVERACSAGGSLGATGFNLLLVAAAVLRVSRRRRECPITQ